MASESNHSPKVSICMPTYNRAKSLKQTLPTVLNQTFKDFELIITDDASPDNTEEVINSFNDSRLRYYRNERNLRMPENLNKAISDAKGEYIAVFHDHDLYEPTVIEEMVALLDKDKRIGFVHTGILWLNDETKEKKNMVSSWDERTTGKTMFEKLLWSWSCPICALTMVRKRCYDEVGLYDPKFGFISDVDMWMRMCMKYDVGYIAKPLITCLEREKDHVYSRFNWEIPQLSVLIHQENLNRYYRNNKGICLIKKLLLYIKRDWLYLKHFAYALYKNDYENLEKGIGLIKKECLPLTKILLLLIEYFYKAKSTKFLVLKLIRILQTSLGGYINIRKKGCK